MEIKLPYGKRNLKLTVPDSELKSVLISRSNEYNYEQTEEEIIHKALNNPINSPPLSSLVRNKKKIVLITSDHTRPVPSHITIPILLKEIRKGNSEADITILVATGNHRKTSKREIEKKFGSKIASMEKIIVHDSQDNNNLDSIGILPSGGELFLNKIALDADLLLAEGFIEPHFFAGFSGGRKSILPGIAGYHTVLANHCSEFIAHKMARTGVLKGNPLHRDMIYASEKAGLAFILNVVLNDNKKIINAFAGHREEAHYRGCEFVSKMAKVINYPSDIVITSNGGYPLDQNLYQSVKSMTAAEAVCKEGGVIIELSECIDGHGGESFYQTFAEAESVEEIMADILARNRYETIPDQWQSQILARVLLKCKVIVVSNLSPELIKNMHMIWASDVNNALKKARGLCDIDYPDITVIPDGVSVIVS